MQTKGLCDLKLKWPGLKVMLLLLSFTFSSYIYAGTPKVEFENANKLYRTGEYATAAKEYEVLLKNGYSSPALFYNLGNAYYKQQQIALAILNYERALKLNPQDEDVLFNLRLANLNTVDKIEPLPKLFYEQWWDQFISLYSSDTWSLLGIITFWLILAFGLLYIFGNAVWMKKIGFFGGTVFLLAGIFLLMAGRVQHERLFGQKTAVIIETSSYVKSSPDDKSTNLFMLHAGTKIDIIDELQGWKKIKIANGNIGWVSNSHLEVI